MCYFCWRVLGPEQSLESVECVYLFNLIFFMPRMYIDVFRAKMTSVYAETLTFNSVFLCIVNELVVDKRQGFCTVKWFH